MEIIINDANILIDLVKLNLMEEFVLLPFNFRTTDFIHNELNDDQKNTIQFYINCEKIELIVTESIEDYDGIISISENNSGLSFEDCSVWYYANKLNCILLTGDGRLRKQAIANGISVRGILFIFDELLNNNLISFKSALEKLDFLCEINQRLPSIAINDRRVSWASKQHLS